MGMKILHSADWHLDSPFGGFSGEQRTLLQKAQRQIPERIARLCRKEGCDLVLLAGDLFDRQPGADTVNQVTEALAECAVPVFIAPGNHDPLLPGNPWQDRRWPENVYIFTSGLESVAVPELDCRIYGAGYRSMDCAPLLENFRREGTEAFHIGLLHADPLTANSPCCPVTAAQVRQSGLTYLALGHIHRAGQFRAGDTLCAWPGCPMGRGWDETGEKSALIVTLEDVPRLQPVSLSLPEFYTLEGEEGELEARLPAAGNENFYRLTLTGTVGRDVQQLRRDLSRFPNLELTDRREDPQALWADLEEDTLRGEYFRRLQELSREDPKALLAAQISRRLLEGREVTLP